MAKTANPERNPDTMPTRRDPSGKCPQCGRVANFGVSSTQPLRQTRPKNGTASEERENAAILKCQGCEFYSVVIEQKIDGEWHGVFWWPTPDLNDVGDIGEDVPSEVGGAYSEGVRCLAVQAPHAAAAMFRTALAHIVDEKGSEAARGKNTLYQRIEQMVKDKTLWESFNDWATHIRETGNAGAHQERWAPLTIEQATDLQKFTRQLIEVLYMVPARLARAMPLPRRSEEENPDGQ